MEPQSSILAWNPYGQRNLVGCSPQDCHESGMTAVTECSLTQFKPNAFH